ncbi:MAG TPA: hypothetical protein VFC78_08565 [Tepidisphaeraceae bacterium]|nr:hypothetical protein [Tepidisphaeraceae bacterium]
MMVLNAKYDGKVLVPDTPLDLPANQRVRRKVRPIESAPTARGAGSGGKLDLGLQRGNILYIAPDFDDPLPDEFWGFEGEK